MSQMRMAMGSRNSEIENRCMAERVSRRAISKQTNYVYLMKPHGKMDVDRYLNRHPVDLGIGLFYFYTPGFLFISLGDL